MVIVQTAALLFIAIVGVAGVLYASNGGSGLASDAAESREVLSQTALMQADAWDQWDGTMRFSSGGDRKARAQRSRAVKRFEVSIREIRTASRPGVAADLLARIEAAHERSTDRQDAVIRAASQGNMSSKTISSALRSHRRLLAGLEQRAAATQSQLAAGEQRYLKTRRNALAASIAALLAALALGYKLLRRSTEGLSGSLARFVQAMRALAAGRTDVKLDSAQMPGELTNAAVAFNQVTDAMEQAQTKHLKQMEHLQQDARLDFLTGLPNRRYFTEELDRDIAQTRRYRYGAALSLIMLDLDHFKSVNDTYGHDVGDEVLKAFAQVIAGCMRRSDFCARLGGEEFAVICPETDAPGAVKAAQKIRQAFAQTPLNGPDGPFFMTLSAGVAVHDVSQGATELIQTADSLLYVAKEKGRNQVCVRQTMHGDRSIG